MDIDDIADSRTHQPSPGEQFRDNWLAGLPRSQWPSYIDESAQLVADGISIGETELTKADFGLETGEFYRRGLAESAGVELGETSLPIGAQSSVNVGKLAWALNFLREELRTSRYTNYENPSRAIEAAVNKALVEKIETGELDSTELETIRLPENATVSTLLSEMLCRPRSETYLNLLIETVNETAASGLLEHLDEPRMVTPLWQHQRDALDAWLAHDCRGYVDMATATGKTFLGLAAVAHHFGTLHPRDRNLTDEHLQPDGTGRATVLVVAHRGLILDQWKREFDNHLNIPEKQGTQSGEHTVSFEWGDIHFWTPNRLKEGHTPETDLVVLDETHHYLGSSGFGSILDDIDGHILALSGSLDEANARTLERRNIPRVYEFSLRDGQRAGVIPQCDWDVVFTSYENQSELAEVTEECRRGIDRYATGVTSPENIDLTETELDESTLDEMAFEFETLSEARSIAQSKVGRELKEQDPEFREFASAIMARQMTQYNLSPSLSTVIRLALDHIDQHKCVVLLETKDEIARVTDELSTQLGETYDELVTVVDTDPDLSAIEAFDREQDNGAIIGIAKTLGEGIDIETADVCINRGRGRLSRSLVQRMGRILRNPDGDKHAQFFHVSGIPTRNDATLLNEDGVAFLETASQLLTWGEQFHARPVFELDTETTLTEHELVELEQAGATAIDDWLPDHYEWPTDEAVQETLQDVCAEIRESNRSALLAIDRQERESLDGPEERGQEIPEEPSADEATQFVAADGGGIEVADWLCELVDAANEANDVEAMIETAVREYLQESITHPKPDAMPSIDSSQEIALNPALDAVLSAYVDPAAREATIYAAVLTTLEGEISDLVQTVDADISASELQPIFSDAQ